MVTQTSKPDTDVQSNHCEKEEVNSTVAQTENAPVAPAGRALSFEEAKAWAMKKYDNALRELAK